MKKRNYIIIGMPRIKKQPGAVFSAVGYAMENRRWITPSGFTDSSPEDIHFFMSYEDAIHFAELKTKTWPQFKFKVYCVTRVK